MAYDRRDVFPSILGLTLAKRHTTCNCLRIKTYKRPRLTVSNTSYAEIQSKDSSIGNSLGNKKVDVLSVDVSPLLIELLSFFPTDNHMCLPSGLITPHQVADQYRRLIIPRHQDSNGIDELFG